MIAETWPKITIDYGYLQSREISSNTAFSLSSQSLIYDSPSYQKQISKKIS